MTTAGAAVPAPPRVARAPRRLSRSSAAAVARLLVWTLLWGTVVRNIGASVGAWAAGSLGAAATILIGVVIPAWVFVVFPSWLAFRIAAPRGMRRLAVGACWMSPLVRARDLPGIAAFLDVAADRARVAWNELPADGWTALAAALQAERRGSLAEAARIVDALAHLPAGARFPWLARLHGVEALVMSAIGRRDGAAAARHARLGEGRAIRLLALVAAAMGGARIPARRLWPAWLLAPGRRTTLALLRGAGRERPTAPAASPAGAHARHVGLLAAAAGGAEIRSDDVLALAAAWRPALGDAAVAAMRARALELGARDPAGCAGALREQVLDELALLLSCAEGPVPSAAEATHAFDDELARRARARQIAGIKAALAALGADRAGGAPHPLEAWQRWLVVRAAWERAEQNDGRAALAALWQAGARDGLWSACCALSHQHGPPAAWAVFMMFDWLADRAEYLGDLVAVLANRENARLALAGTR